MLCKHFERLVTQGAGSVCKCTYSPTPWRRQELLFTGQQEAFLERHNVAGGLTASVEPSRVAVKENQLYFSSLPDKVCDIFHNTPVLSDDRCYITHLKVWLYCLEGSWERKCFKSEVSSVFTLGYPFMWSQLCRAPLAGFADLGTYSRWSDLH